MPKVSVVIPVYNVENYLKECIDSVRNQTLEDIEIICVDDGSTDSSLSILNDFSKEDERVKVLTQENKYAGVARNTGFAVATGEYVLFLDSDDFFEKEMLEKTYEKATATNADIVLFGGRTYNNKTGKYGEKSKTWVDFSLIKQFETFSYKDLPEKIFQVTTGAPWTKLYRSEFVREKELAFQNLKTTNDAFFTMTSLCKAERISYVDEVFVNYRVGMESNLQSSREKEPLLVFEAYDAVYDELNKLGIYEEVEQSFVNAYVHISWYTFSTLWQKSSQEMVIKHLSSKSKLFHHDADYYYIRGEYYAIESMRYIRENADAISKVIEDNMDYANEFLASMKLSSIDRTKDFTALDTLEYFIKYISLYRKCYSTKLDELTGEKISKEINNLVDITLTCFENMPGEQRYFYFALPLNLQNKFVQEIFNSFRKSSEVESLKKGIENRDNKIKALESEIYMIKNSKSFKIGRIITAPIRKIRK